MVSIKTPLRLAALALPFTLTGLAHATLPGWNYAELSYAVDGHTSRLGTPVRPDASGFALDGAASLNDFFYLRAGVTAWDFSPVMLGSIDTQLQDWSRFGAGVHYPLALHGVELDFWAEASLDRVGFQSIAGNGFGYAAGVLASVNPQWTIGAWYRGARTDTEMSGDDIDIDPSAKGLDLFYRINDRVQVRLGRYWGELDLSTSGGLDEELDIVVTELGLRYLFDGKVSPRGTAAPDMLGYNSLQFAYLLSGESDLKGGGSPTENVDAESGFVLDGRVAPWQNVFLGAHYTAISYDLSDLTGSDNMVLDDHLSIGPGVFYTLDRGDLKASGYAQVTYDRLTGVQGGIIAKGTGFRVGVRGAIGMFDAELFFRKAHTSESVSGQHIRFKPEAYGLDVAVSPFDNGLAFTLGYLQQKTDIEAGGFDVETDSQNWLLGVRQSF